MALVEIVREALPAKILLLSHEFLSCATLFGDSVLWQGEHRQGTATDTILLCVSLYTPRCRL